MDPAFVLNRKRNREKSTDYKLCIICQSDITGRTTCKLGNQGIKKLQEAATIRWQLRDIAHVDCIDRLKDISTDFSTEDVQLLYHKSCYSSFTSSTHIERLRLHTSTVKSSEATAAPCCEPIRASRRVVPALDKHLCIFCQTDTGKTTCLIMQLDVSNEIINASQKDFVMRSRLAGLIDLVAADARYHPKCKIQFLRKMEKDKSEDASSPQAVCVGKVVDEIRCGISCGNVYTLQDVWNRYSFLLSDAFGVETGSYKDNKTRFKQKLTKELLDEVEFVPQLDSRKPQLLFGSCPSKSLMQILKSRSDACSEKMVEQSLQPLNISDCPNDMVALFHTALMIRNQLKSVPVFNSCTAITSDNAAKLVPESLYLFLRVLFTGDSETTIEDDSPVHSRVLSISQDILYAMTKGRKLTPKHIGLGLTIHQATRSRRLVDLFHAAGHCVSYDVVRQVDTSLAQKALDDMGSSIGVPIPSNIEHDRFFQFAADNIDLIEETLDGQGTFHATQMVVFQRGPKVHVSDEKEIFVGKRRSLQIAEELRELKIPPSFSTNPKPQFANDITLDIFDSDAQAFNNGRNTDLIWLLSRLANSSEQCIPAWSGFNSIASSVNPAKTSVGFLPILNAPAHEQETIWTVMDRCIQISTAMNPGQSTVLTLDQALYCKAKQLQWANPGPCASLVIKLGGFHIALTFMRVIGQHFTDSGLVDVWVESSVYGENTAKNNLLAKSYNRTLRAHKLTFEALWRIMWKELVDWTKDHNGPVMTDIMYKAGHIAGAMENLSDNSVISSEIAKMIHAFPTDEFNDILKAFDAERPSTFIYWRQYMEMVSVLLLFIRAEREGNWELHLSSFAAMLPWFAVYDHTNYTRWGTVYLADMRQLNKTHPDVYQEFMNGNFVVKRSDHLFNQLSTDQALEHVNKICKVAGGLIGITRSDSARDRWCLTFNERSDIVEKTCNMFHMQDDDPDVDVSIHKENGPTRIARDETDVVKIKEQLERFGMFKQSESLLVSLSSHDLATEVITTSLLNAESKGTQKVQDFIEQRLCAQKLGFYERLAKCNLPTFRSLYVKKTSVSKDKTKVLKADRSLLQRIIRAQLSGRKIDMCELLKHELFPVPLSLADTAGNLLSASDKSILQHIIEGDVCSDRLPPSNGMKTCTIIDGQALVMALGKPKEAHSFSDLACTFIKAVLKHVREDCSRVDVVFDRYEDKSIKGATRDKRASGRRPIRRLIENGDVPLPSNWNDFISHTDNKSNLANFLSEELMRQTTVADAEIVTAGGFTDIQTAKSSTGRDVSFLKAAHEEADTRIVLHAIDASKQGYKRTIVVCRDTDVLVLLIYFTRQLTAEVWFQTGTSKKHKFIPIHKINISEQEKSVLPAFHAVTGCDTVSKLAGHSKKSAWPVFRDHLDLLRNLGKGELNAHTLHNAEAFICKIFSPSVESSSTDELRWKLFLTGKRELNNLPPTSDSVELHITRAHYQTRIWLSSDQPVPTLSSPIGNGWFESEGMFKPLLMRKDPVPKACEELLTCNCKNCVTKRCTCRTHKLKCISACGCSDKGQCGNPLNEDIDSEGE